jgi:ATP-dependent Lhr-like helicase
VDWRRRQVFVVPGEGRGRSVWQGSAAVMGYELAQAVRDVLAGVDPDVELSARAVARLGSVREEFAWVGPGTAIDSDRWWTWAGSRANAALAAALGGRADGLSVVVDSPLTVADVRAVEPRVPVVDEAALEGLKFSALLPVEVAAEELAERVADVEVAWEITKNPVSPLNDA